MYDSYDPLCPGPGAPRRAPPRLRSRNPAVALVYLIAALVLLAPAGIWSQVNRDSHLPEVSVRLVGGVLEPFDDFPVLEGNVIRFELTRTGALTAALAVELEVTYNGSRQTRTATFPAGEQTVAVDVATDENEVVDAAHHSLTVAIQPAATYQVSSESGMVSVAVPDDDIEIFVRRAPLSPESVVEGETDYYDFEVSRNGDTSLELVSVYMFAQFGDGAVTTTGNVNFDAGQASKQARLRLPADDDLHQADFTVTYGVAAIVEQQENRSYRLGDPHTATFRVLDDDLPVVGIAVAPESGDEGTDFQITATRDGTTGESLTVLLSVTSSGDFGTVASSSVTFPLGAADTTLTLPTDDDDLDEADGTLTVTLDANDAYQIDADAGTRSVTVRDNDLVQVSISADHDDGVTEGETLTFTLARGAHNTDALDVTVDVSETGKMVANDQEGSRTVSFGSGQASVSFTVSTSDDETAEQESTVSARIEDMDAYAPGSPSTASVTVRDDDQTVILTVDPDAVTEDGGAQTVTVTAALHDHTSTRDTPIDVTVSVAGVTATAGTDFAAVADFPVTIPANARSGEGTFILNAIDDDAFEEDKTLTVGGAATGLKVTTATLTLTDEDVETLLQAVHRDGAETNATTVRGILVMRVFFKGAETVTGFTADDIEVTGGAITEFRRTDSPGRIVHFVWIDAAEDAEMLTFVVRKDAIEEGNFRAEATYTVVPPFTVTLTSEATGPVQGDFVVLATFSEPVNSGSGATESVAHLFIVDEDVDVVHGRRLYSNEVSATQWRITIRPDAGFYGTLRVTIAENAASLLNNSHIFNQAAEFEILVDTVFDDAALASLSLTDPHGSGVGLDPAFSSGHTGYEATFGRGVTVRVHAEVRDPGATFVIEPRFDQSDQSAGHDVLLTPGRATEITVTVTAEDRTTRRTYTVQLVNAIVTLAVTPSRIGEDGGSATVTATIDPPFSQEVRVTVAPEAVAPAARADFIVSDHNWLDFPANATAGTGTVTITAVSNDLQTLDKEVRVNGTTLAPGVPVIGTTLTIEDDDRVAKLTLNPESVGEEGGAQTVTVTATIDPQSSTRDKPTAVIVSLAGGTATEGTDFAAVADFPVTIPANARSGAGTFTLNAIDDDAFEEDETIIVSGVPFTLTSTGATLTLTGATLTMTENDVPWVTMESTEASVEEGGSVTLTLTREGSVTNPLTIPGSLLRSRISLGEEYREHPVTFEAGEATATLTVGPPDDAVFYTHRQFNVELDTSDPRMFRLRRASSSAAFISIESQTYFAFPVDDDDPVRVTITPQDDRVSEASRACFTVSTDVVFRLGVPAELTFAVTASQQGDFLSVAPGSHTVTLSNSTDANASETSTLCLDLHDDDEFEGDGSVTLQLGEGTVRLVVDNQERQAPDVVAADATVTVTVSDNDVPWVTIESAAASVDEGGSVTFTLTREGPLTDPLTIPGTLLRSKISFGHGYSAHPVTFEAGEATATLIVGPPDDEVFYTHRQFNVELDTRHPWMPDPRRFRLRRTSSPASPAVFFSDESKTHFAFPVDDDDPVRVTITPQEDPVSEASRACFTVSTDVFFRLGVLAELTFAVAASQRGDFLAEPPGSHTVTLSNSTTDANASETPTLCLDLDDDDEGEADGSVTLQLDEGTVRLVVYDQERPAPDVVAAEDGAGTATVGVFDNEIAQMVGYHEGALPFVPHTGDGRIHIDEGDEVCFAIQRWGRDALGNVREGENYVNGFDVRFPIPPLTVNIDASIIYSIVPDEPDFLAGPLPTTVVFPASDEDVFVQRTCIETVDDDVLETDGIFAVSIADGLYRRRRTSELAAPSHRPASLYALVDLVMRDNDRPTTSITTNSESVEEGEDIVLTVTRRDNDIVSPLNTTVRILRSNSRNVDSYIIGGGEVTLFQPSIGAPFGRNVTTVIRSLEIPDDDVDGDDFFLHFGFSPLARDYHIPDGRHPVVRVTDDDARGVTVSPTSLSIHEGSESSYTVELDSEPTADVTVAVGGMAGTDVSVNPESLTFTRNNWNTAQTIAVSTREDADKLADVVRLTHTATGGDYGANGVTVDLEVTVEEYASIRLTLDPTSVPESAGHYGPPPGGGGVSAWRGATVTVTATLNTAARTEDTVVRVSVAGNTASTSDLREEVEPFNLTIPANAQSGEAQFTLIPFNDNSAESDETLTVSGMLTVPVSWLTVESAELTLADDDEVSVLVEPTTLEIDEGSSATYSVALTSAPTEDVTISMTVSGDSDISVQPASLTFTTIDWYVARARPVTVEAAADADAAAGTATIAHGVTTSGDYDGIVAASVTVTEKDNDTASTTATLSVSPSSVAERGGGQDVTVTATLNAATRTEDTVVRVSVAGNTAGTGDFQAVESFDLMIPANAQSGEVPFRLTPVVDGVIEEDETVTVSGTVPVSSGLTVESATVTIIDDARGVTVSPTELTVDEGGDDTYTVVLTSEPTADVTVTVTTDLAGTDVSVDKTTLTFTADNWDDEQTVTVSAAGDNDAVADETVTLTHSVSSTGDYASETADAVAVTIAETDTPTLSMSGVRADEDVGDMTFTVTLSVASSNAVTVAYATSNGTGAGAATAGEDYTLTNGTLTFEAGTTTAQEIRVAITDDAVDEADEETFTVTLSSASNATLAGGQSTLAATGTITDDDERGVTVSETALDIDEGESGTYTVVLTSQPTGTVTVAMTTDLVDTDVSVDNTSLTFTAGNWNTAQTVTVSAAGDEDAVVDDAVTLTHTVRGGDYGSVSADPVAVTIVEDDTPTLSMADVRADEDVGETVFTVTLSLASSNEVTVAYATSNGTGAGAATAGEDYTEKTGTLTFEAGTTTAQEIRVPITDDAVDEEEEETFTVTLHSAANATLAGAQATLAATGTIVDNDDPAVTVAFATGTYTATEGGAAATVQVQLSGDPERTVDIPLTHTPGTGATAADYSGVPESVTFASGETEKTFAVSATDDDVDEDEETVTLGFGTRPDGVTLGSQSSATVTLADDDARGVTVTPTALTVDEGGDETYTVVLDSEPTADVAVTVTTDLADTDLSLDKTSLTFTADNWNTAQTVTVSAAGDEDAVVDDAVTLTHTVRGGDYGSVTAHAVAVTIVEDDTPTLSMSGVRADEDVGEMVFEVTLSLASSNEVTVAYATSNGTGAGAATAGEDYTEKTGTLTFEAGTTTAQEIRVAITDDAVDEADEETFTVTLSNASNATLTGGQPTLAATGTITDDDGTPTVTLSLSEGSIGEDGETSRVTATLSGVSSEATTVTVSAMAVSPAAAGDFTLSTNKVLAIAAGQTASSGDVTITAVNNDVDAANKTVTVSGDASNILGATDPADLTLTITDDDARGVTVTPTALSVGEGDSEEYTVVLTSHPTANVTVTVNVPQGTDVSVDKTSLTFTAGNWDDEQTVTVSAAGDEDAVVDDAVTLTHTVSSTGDYASETAADVAVTIAETDTPTLSIADESVAEDAGSATFTVTLSVASSNAVTVDYATSNGTGPEAATAGEDYTEANGTLTFPANSTTPKTIAVPITDDAVDEEEEETFTVTLSNASNATLAGGQPTLAATGTITDDDERGVTVTPTAVTVDEGGDETYTVALDSEPTADVAVTVTTDLAGTDVSVDKTSLTFTADNWNDEQTVTVSAAEDDDAVVDATVTLTHSVSSTGDYNGETAADVAVTIVETDTPTLSIADESVAEDAGSATFTVTLSVASSNAVTVDYATSNGTGAGAATAGEDYTLTNGTLTFEAGTTTAQEIRVAITDDAVDEEEEETFTVTLSSASNATLAGGQPTLAATGTITDDDERGVTVTPTAVTVDEGGDETYTVVLDSEPTADVAVTVTTDLAGTDVSVDETSLTFTADNWNDEQTVTVSAAGDDDAVVDATVTLTHSVSSTGDYNGETAADVAVTIVETDTPTLSMSGVRADEDIGEMVFTVTLSLASSNEVTVAYATSNGTGAGAATAGEDYTEKTGTLTFEAGTTTAQEIRVAITDDAVDEADETFTVTLSSASNATLTGGQPTLAATGTITDDDERGVTVTPTALSVGEGDSEGYTVVLTSQPTADVTVAMTTDLAGTDVSVDETSLTFTADDWDDEQTVTVSAAEDNDAVVDATVTLTHSVSSTGDYNGETAADVAVTIAETDTPTLSMSGVRADEDIGEMVFEVTLSLASSNQVRVQYRTSEGTATAGSDYTEKTGTLTFPANSTVSQTVRVSIANDDVDEPDEETFTVTLSSASNATLAGGQSTLAATGTITDDDARGVTVSPTALTVDEGGDETYTVVLDSEPTASVTVTVTTDLADTDLSLDKTSLTFTADNWSTAQTVTVRAAGDEDAVVDETVTLTHSVSSTGDYNGETAADLAVTIVEDDTPTLSIANRSATESAGTMVFTVTLSVASSQTVTVAYATSNGTGAEAATAGEDYTEANGTLTFPANSTTPKTIAVPITDDAVDEEEEETFTLTLSNASNATLAGAQATLAATGTITDDEARGVTVTPTALTVDEGGDETYTVALDSEPTADVTVTVTVPTGTDVSVDKRV